MPRLDHDRPGLTYACPACDSATIYERTGNGNTSNHPDRPYSCQSCGVALEYIIERPKKSVGGPSRQKTLVDGIRGGEYPSSKVKAVAPEDVGLSPIGVRGGAD